MKFLFFIFSYIFNINAFLFSNNYFLKNTKSKLYSLPTIRCVSSIHRNYTNTNCKSFIIDIDGTICNTKNSNYTTSIPRYKNINLFNKLYDQGHQLHYWTARGANSGLDWDEFTVLQLKTWKVKYTTINMGKPHYDVWIDDKAINANDVSHILLGIDLS
tara:strand:- start:850 stop:1326 length:477 start_codon:yes stop_codon:yes gene_type:complete